MGAPLGWGVFQSKTICKMYYKKLPVFLFVTKEVKNYAGFISPIFLIIFILFVPKTFWKSNPRIKKRGDKTKIFLIHSIGQRI
jgi:hypothetical protein